MKPVVCWMAVLVDTAVVMLVFADPGKDESGYGHYKHEYAGQPGSKAKESYWDGDCKIERQWKKSGKYKEKHHCKAPCVFR